MRKSSSCICAAGVAERRFDRCGQARRRATAPRNRCAPSRRQSRAVHSKLADPARLPPTSNSAGGFAGHEAVGVVCASAGAPRVRRLKVGQSAGCRSPRSARAGCLRFVDQRARACDQAIATPTRPCGMTTRIAVRSRLASSLLELSRSSSSSSPSMRPGPFASRQHTAAAECRATRRGHRREALFDRHRRHLRAAWSRPRHGCSSGTWCAMIHSPRESMKRVSVGWSAWRGSPHRRQARTGRRW